jgi:hypothetical protein
MTLSIIDKIYYVPKVSPFPGIIFVSYATVLDIAKCFSLPYLI